MVRCLVDPRLAVPPFERGDTKPRPRLPERDFAEDPQQLLLQRLPIIGRAVDAPKGARHPPEPSGSREYDPAPLEVDVADLGGADAPSERERDDAPSAGAGDHVEMLRHGPGA
jgi:hypothetical protein